MMALAIVLLVLWMMSLVVFKVTSAVIHLLVVAAVAVFLYRLLTGRRATRI